MTKFLTILPIFILLNLSCGKKIEDNKSSEPTFGSEDLSKSPQEDPNKVKKQKLYDAIIGNAQSLIENALLELNNEIDFHFENGETPITFAIKNAETTITKKLINNSKNLNLSNKSGDTPLILVIKQKNNYLLSLLLTKKVDVNIGDISGIAPIIYSLEQENEITAIKLMSHGADSTVVDIDGLNVNHHVKRLRFTRLNELISFVNSHKKISNKNLNNAVKSGNVDFLDYLLNNFEKYNELLKKRNLLITAIDIKNDIDRNEMIERLLQRGSNPNNTEGITPLIHAAIKDKLSVVKKLLNYRADPTVYDDEGLSALNYAAANINTEMTNLLITSLYSRVWTESPSHFFKYLDEACTSLPSSRQLNRAGDNAWKKARLIDKKLGCFKY